MAFIVRATSRRDLPAVGTLCSGLYKQQLGAEKLLHDSPTVRFTQHITPEQAQWAAHAAEDAPYSCSTAYISVCAIAPQHELEVSTMLLRSALASLPLVQKVQVVLSADASLHEPGLASLFTPIVARPAGPVRVYQTTRADVLPPLSLRTAREEDHDDMLPVLHRAEARFPALAKLPESSRPEEPFALTRVVAGQDAANVVLVAHDASGSTEGLQQSQRQPSKAVMAGFMVLTSEVDVSALVDVFDLHPYDNFLPEEEYERQYQQATESVRLKKRNTLEAKLGDRVLRASSGQIPSAAEDADGNTQATADKSSTADLPTSPTVDAEEGTGDDNGNGAQAQDRPQSSDLIDISAACEPNEEEVWAEMGTLFHSSDVEPTVFAITMACVDEPYMSYSLDFLRQAFEAFPDKMYCLLTLPHDTVEPQLVAPFTRLAPVAGATFPEVLYLFHRHSLMDQFNVRLAVTKDTDSVSLLISGMPNSADIQELFGAALDRGTAVVALAQQEVVGLVTISTQVDVPLLQANYELAGLLDVSQHPTEAHGEIDLLCINPIFARHARSVLSAAQRLLHKSVLYYALPAGQPPPDTLDVMLQVPPRSSRQAPTDSAQELNPLPEFALYMIARRHLCAPRRVVNARVVVVGASEAGLAAVQRLLVCQELLFSYITLLAPGGITTAGFNNHYNEVMLGKLGLDARVRVVDAELVGLDAESRIIELSDGHQLAYDLLLITAGLQEQTCNDMAELDADAAGVVLNADELSSGLSSNDAADMQQVLVYGHTLDAYQALAALEEKGALQKTVFYAPPASLNSPAPVVQVLQQCASQLQVDLPLPKELTLCSMSLQPEAQASNSELLSPRANMRVNVQLQGPPGLPKQEQAVDLVVGCQPRQASKSVFMCLNSASVVFDGRVVVDCAFRTTQPAIYAAGTIAKLSRRYGRQVNFEHYNSVEVGCALGDAVIAALAAQQQPEPAQGCEEQPVKLGQGPARVLGCSVPGGMHFLYTGCPKALAQPSLEAPSGGLALATTSDRGVMHVVLDASGSVHCIAYLGKQPLPPHRLACLVSLHHSYLNDLVQKWEAQQVPCLVDHLTRQAWSQLLCHENFTQLRQQLLQECAGDLAASKHMPDILGAAQQQVVEFVQVRQNELAGFAVPVQG